MRLGSLFDGIGGFPLAAVINGIIPVWASEIEAAPISITKRHFPDMVHLGDITKIDGSKIEPVDIITFGSPCQDLSLAGKRQGLSGERSGLFIEAIRIIKEMRGKTNGKYPARIIWENVTGAFSSNEGEDFRIVLEEIASITAGGGFSIPRPPKDGWLSAGTIMGDCYSIAWRVMDAQYWGVPQRRKRIFLIADFTGGCAAEILFKPDGLPGDNTESGEAREGIAGNAENRPIASGFNGWRSVTGDIEYKEECAPTMQTKMPSNVVYGMAPKQLSQNVTENVSPPIMANDYKEPNCVYVDGFNQNMAKEDKANTLRGARVDASNIGLIFEKTKDQYAVDFGRTADRIQMNADKAVTLLGEGGGGGAKTGLYCLPVTYCLQGNMIGRDDKNGPQGDGINENVSFTLNTIDRHAVALDCRNHTVNEELSAPLQAKKGQSLNYINPAFTMQGFGDYKETGTASTIKGRDGKDSTDLINADFAVRRLTPVECERLQGFPDGWTEYGINPEKKSKSKISDSARYKALGNSVAIPCVDFLMSRISEGLHG